MGIILVSNEHDRKAIGGLSIVSYHWLWIGRGAIGRYLAAEQIDDYIWNVYRNVLLGYFDERRFMKKEGYQKLTPPEV